MNTPTDSILLHLRLSRAFALARRGQWHEAERSLAQADGGWPDNPLALHALAAVVTSEGDYERALTLWQRLLQHDPNHVEARRMIAAIDLWMTRPSWVRYVPYGVGAALVGALLLVVLALFSEPTKPAQTNGNLPVGVNATIVDTEPANPVYAGATPTPRTVANPTPLPPINFSVPSSRHHGH